MNNKVIDQNKIIKFCQNNDIRFIGIFGSFARGDFSEESDIDFLVRFSRPKSLLEFVRMERELSKVLGRKTELLTEASISPYLRANIIKELKVLYEKT